MPGLDDFSFGAQTPATPAPAPQKKNIVQKSLDDFVFGSKPVAKPKVQHDPGWWDRVVQVSKDFASSPVAQGANAVLGAPDNFIVGAELAAANKGNLGDIARGGWTGMTHPGEATENVHQLEKKWHLPVADEKTANFAQRSAQVVEDTTLQMQSAIIPGLDLFTGAKWLGGIVRAIPGVEAASKVVAGSKAVDLAIGAMDADHELNKFVKPLGRAEVKAAQATPLTVLNAAGKPLRHDTDAISAAVANMGGLKNGVTQAQFKTFLDIKAGMVQAESTLNNAKIDKNLLRWVSDYQRDALFLLPFAHAKNLTVLAALGPDGINTIRKGIMYARKLAKGDAATLAKLDPLKDLGVAAEYRAAGQVNKFAKLPGVGKISDWSNKVLSDYDNGLRLALSDTLMKRGMSGPEMASQLRDVMGDYLHPSDMTKGLRNMGANFPQWRTQIVPKAMFKAVREQPTAAKLYARANANIANDITMPMVGASWDTGGPGEDAAKMATFPVGTMNYSTAHGTLGPLSDMFAAKEALSEGKLGQWAKGEIEQFVPFGSVIDKLPGLNPYPDPGSPLVNTVLGAAGAYMPTVQTDKAEMASMGRMGMKGADKNAVMEVKGKRRKQSNYQSLEDYTFK